MNERLSEICRTHLLREKILVVPSLAIGHQIADAIAHGGTPWVNLRVETIRTLSDAVAGFALASDGVTVLSRAQALALVERVCDRVLDSSTYFAALADRPGLHRAIQKSIEDLGHAGLEPSDVTPQSFEDERKARDIARVLAGYREELAAGRYVDRLGVLGRAISLLRGSDGGVPLRTWAADATWIVIEDVELTAVEKEFLDAVSGGRYEVLRAPGPPRFLATLGMTGETRITDRSRASSSSSSSTPSPSSAPAVASISFRRAVGEENELRSVFRRILESASAFDEAEVAYTTRDPYLPLAYELSAEYGVPCTFSEGIAAHFTRPGQAVLAFLQWIGNGWHVADLRAFAGPHSRVLRRAKIGWRRDRYLPRIDALIAEYDDEEDADRIEGAQKARDFVRELLEISEPVATGDAIDVATAAACAAQFVERFGTPRNEVDGMAHHALIRLFRELSVLPTGETARVEAARRLADAASALHVSASNPRPGFLHVAPVRAAGWSARSQLFVVGLDESRDPGSGLQDPVILDSERTAIGLPVVGDRPQRTSEAFRRLLARAASREITLSYSSLSLRDRRERFPSTDFVELSRSAPEVVVDGFVDPQPLSVSDWWLLRRFVYGDANIRPAILDAHPHLADGARAEEARAGDAITAWDGKIDAPREELDPRLNGKTYSASQLENMAGCPYRYFLERLLRVRPLDDIEFEPDTWLEARHFGELMHDVLQKTMEELCAAGQKPALTFLPRMIEIAEEGLAEWREEIPPPNETAFERRRTELIEAAEIFLRAEEVACRDVTPKHFELEFGPWDLPLGRGKSVRLRGRIDRVDHDETADEWHVWDYKSGGTYQFDAGGRLNCGTKIQHAIYARAVADLVGGRVTRSGYFFPTAKGNGARLDRECTDIELKKALNLLFDTVSAGWYPHASEEACKFCDFKAVCGSAKLGGERTEKKLASNANDPAVKAWLDLQEVK